MGHPGQDPRFRRLGTPRLRLRRRALRRCRARSLRLLRPETERAGRQRARVRRLPHGDGQFPALARQRRSEVPAPAAAAPAEPERRRPAVPADRRRRFPDQRRERQRLQQSSPERPRQDHLHAAAEHQGHRSRDQRAVGRHVRGRVAERSDGQRRCPHRTQRQWTRVVSRPEPVRWLPDGRPRHDTAGAGARRAHQSRARSRSPRRSGCSTTCPRSSGSCSRTLVFAPCPMPCERARSAAGSRSAAQRARGAGQGGVRSCLRPLPRRPRTVDATGPGRFDITSCRASVHVPSTPSTPARFAFAACPPQLARNARTYEIALSAPTPSPGGLLPAGTKVRRTSSDPGRALLTGYVGGPLRAAGRLGQVRHAGTARDPQDRSVLPQQQRGDPRGRRRSLHRRSSARGRLLAPPGVLAASRYDRRRELRSAAAARRARGAPGVSAEALENFGDRTVTRDSLSRLAAPVSSTRSSRS